MYPTSDIRIGMILIWTIIYLISMHLRINKLGGPISQKEAQIRIVIYIVVAVLLEIIWGVFIAP